MDVGFWQNRWDNQQIGFHEAKPNRFLERFGERLGQGAALVPLCGKSRDLDALAARGFEVTGVELIERAVVDFFSERRLSPTREAGAEHEAYVSGPLRVVRGDFLRCPLTAEYDAVFDRAALIALPPQTRPAYAARTLELLRPGGRVLLVTLEHDAPSGPPFSVEKGEVAALYGEACELEELLFEDVLADSANLVAKGATRAGERVYLLEKRRP